MCDWVNHAEKALNVYKYKSLLVGKPTGVETYMIHPDSLSDMVCPEFLRRKHINLIIPVAPQGA